MAFEHRHPPPRSGGRVLAAQSCGWQAAQRLRGPVPAGSGRPGVTQTRQQPWDCSRRARAGHHPSGCKAIPSAEADRYRTTSANSAESRPRCLHSRRGRALPHRRHRARLSWERGEPAPPGSGRQRLGTLGKTFSRHPKRVVVFGFVFVF